jgi:hypothetical protein
MRREYDGAIRAFEMRARDLFLPDGARPPLGSCASSFATLFWRGYDGVAFGTGWDAVSRKTIGYAIWCAGRDLARAQAARMRRPNA